MKIIEPLFGWLLRPLDSSERKAMWITLVIVCLHVLGGAALAPVIHRQRLAVSISIGALVGISFGAMVVAGLSVIAARLGKLEAKAQTEATEED